MKVSGCKILATGDLFLLEQHQQNVTLSHGIRTYPRKYSHCWTISLKNNSTNHAIAMECLHSKVMKCDRTMKELLIQARKEFDLSYPGTKPRKNQNNKTTKQTGTSHKDYIEEIKKLYQKVCIDQEVFKCQSTVISR